MKRASIILAAAAAGAMFASAPARAAGEMMEVHVLDSVYETLGLTKDGDLEDSRNGFFIGVHRGLGLDSGLSPVASGLTSSLSFDYTSTASIAANGYYVYQTNFSVGTYVGGGFGRFRLFDDPLMNPALPRGNLAVQGIAGLTFAFSDSMALGLEYRYAENVPEKLATTTPDAAADQSVTLRFDFLLN